ncbi:MAG: SRPBCC family protein [Dehalococcoidia bacterium]|nr:SRPBCC family protein [Dehalococcoidia bacterium]
MTDPSPAVAALSNTLAVEMASDREIRMTRTFAAPRQRVWDAFTRAEHLKHWWGPRGFSLDPNRMDFRVGGTWHYAMVSDFMPPSWGKMTYLEIAEPVRFVATDAFSDESGATIPPESTGTFEFEEQGNATLIRMRTVYPDAEGLRTVIEMGMMEGMGSTLDRLDDLLAGRPDALSGRNGATLLLPSDTEIVLGRTFNAPPALVWQALTTPAHLRNWWGPTWMELAECEMDVRVGGRWRFVQRDPKTGDLYPFSGEYREIVAGERIVQTEWFEAIPGAESVVTLTLEARGDNATRLTSRSSYAAREFRDGHLQAGMEVGMRETYDRLEALLATL